MDGKYVTIEYNGGMESIKVFVFGTPSMTKEQWEKLARNQLLSIANDPYTKIIL
jgi:hypothetical protein